MFTTDNMTWFDYLPELSPVTTPAASHMVNVIKKEMTSTITNILLYDEWVKSFSANNVAVIGDQYYLCLPLSLLPFAKSLEIEYPNEINVNIIKNESLEII